MRTFFLLIVMLSLASCRSCKEKSESELCSARQINDSEALKLNGFYYRTFGIPERWVIHFLNQNGTLLSTLSVNASDSLQIESILNQNGFYNGQAVLSSWGIYVIDGDNIRTEKWHPSNIGHDVYARVGKIINDSTFVLERSFRCDGSESSNELEVYHFREFSPKPDSISPYIP